MNDTALAAITGILFLFYFLVSFLAYALTDFSRSKLDEICHKYGDESRFGKILKSHENHLLVLEAFKVLLGFSMIFSAFVWLTGYRWKWEGWNDRLLFCSTLVVFAMVLIAARVVFPWTLARVSGEKFLYRSWPVLRVLFQLGQPFLSIAKKVDTLMHRLTGVEESANGDAESIAEEIRTVVDEGQREGLLESEARTMIHRVMELHEEDTAAIMTPRTDMVCIQVESSLEEARQRLLSAGHSRIPVIGESTDDIVGILYAKDLLRQFHKPEQKEVTLKEILREPQYVPETTGIDTLLQTMRKERVHMAIVVDEYGGVAGLVSMEDILEEIVGEIVDEYDAAEDDGINKVSADVTEVESRVHIDDLNEMFDFDLPEHGDYDTIGGFVFTRLGKIPVAGDSFTWNQLRFKVLDADKRKINKLRIEVDRSNMPQLGEV